jgi:hypothetical protein
MSFNRLLFGHDDTSARPHRPDTFAIFEDLCLLGNGERPQFAQLESLYKTFALDMIERVLTNNHKLFHKVRLSSPLPIRDPYCMLVAILESFMSTAFRVLTLITNATL